METMMKYLPVLALLLLASIAGLEMADATGECGNQSPDRIAFQLAPCASASQNKNAAVSAPCCSAVQRIGQNPSCLCAVMLSKTAKNAGVSPEVAITIPKRCNISNRPVGSKCGGYTLP
ncbi:hypothetical protein HPP92_003033 [Vanilla planifolia]|uniref:Bifunctional inhibitor/plant lipid transfer protein/seed storage helical domain-containing protein n=1 Tax=Vanilla planifolia TaxID=51239 RepID=A0A835VN98_VANPL|nr:hypothetical protein HPP92_003033 [Vanilla planifolia]